MKKLLVSILLTLSVASLFGMEQDKEINNNKNIAKAFSACRSGDHETLKTLLEKGLNPNIALGAPLVPFGFYSTRLLHWAAAGGHAKIVDLLLEYNANLHLTDENNDTPLHAAVCNMHPDIVQKLLHAGAQVDKSHLPSGSKPLHTLCKAAKKNVVNQDKTEQALKIIILLREYGAQNWKLTTFYDSPFHCIAPANSPELVCSLIVPLNTEKVRKNARNRLKTLLLIINRFNKNRAYPINKDMIQYIFSFLPVDCYQANLESLVVPRFIKKDVFEQQWIQSYIAEIKKLTKEDVTVNVKAIKARMSKQEIATLEQTLDIQNATEKKPMDLTTNAKVKILLSPKTWK